MRSAPSRTANSRSPRLVTGLDSAVDSIRPARSLDFRRCPRPPLAQSASMRRPWCWWTIGRSSSVTNTGLLFRRRPHPLDDHAVNLAAQAVQGNQHLQHRNIRAVIFPCSVGWITRKVSHAQSVTFTYCANPLQFSERARLNCGDFVAIEIKHLHSTRQENIGCGARAQIGHVFFLLFPLFRI
jgi:hypothetical protein